MYDALIDIVDCCFNYPPTNGCTNINRYIQIHKQSSWNDSLKILKSFQSELAEKDISIELPSGLYHEHPLSYLGFIVHVNDPTNVMNTVQTVSSVLVRNKYLVTYFCLIPVYQGERWMSEGYIISSDNLQKWADDTVEHWEFLVPREIPEAVLNTLPTYPIKTIPVFQFIDKHKLLLMSLANLPELWDHIKPFENADCSFKKRLFERLKQKADAHRKGFPHFGESNGFNLREFVRCRH